MDISPTIFQIETDDLSAVALKLQLKGFTKQSLAQQTAGAYNLELWYQHKGSTPKWKPFIRPILNANQPAGESDKTASEGYVLLFQNTSSNVIFSIVAGSGYFAIIDLLNHEFGIDLFCRIIKKEDKVLSSTREKSLVGGEIGSSKSFRTRNNIFDLDNFGKIFQELKAYVDKDVLRDKLGVPDAYVKKGSSCVAKTSSFKINRPMDLAGIAQAMSGIEHIIATESAIPINNVRKLSKKKDKLIIEELFNELFEQLWQRYSQAPDTFSFDLYPREFEKYLTASKYVVTRVSSDKNLFKNYEFSANGLSDVDLLFEQFRRFKFKIKDSQALERRLKNLKITSYDENGEFLTGEPVLNHIMGDVRLPQGGKYFFIDRGWYQIEDEFITELDENLKYFALNEPHKELVETWDCEKETENEYNQKYLSKPNTLVLDRVTPEFIEVCDILQWDNDNLYLCHIKAGFGNQIRDLAAQVLIAAKRLIVNRNSSGVFIDKLYDNVAQLTGDSDYSKKVKAQFKNISKTQFRKLFQKRIVFVMGILDKSNKKRIFSEPEKFNSNIAKFAIRELEIRMRGIGAPLRIAQIFAP